MKAKSIKGKSTEEIKSELEQSKADARPDDPVGRGYITLAFVFISIKQDIQAVSNLHATPAAEWL